MNITSLIQTETKKKKKSKFDGKKLLIFTPTIDGKIYGNTTQSLLEGTIHLWKTLGVKSTYNILANCPYLYHARNCACKTAIVNDYDYLLFLDSDVIFTEDSISKLILNDKDVCVGGYPHKVDETSFVFSTLPDEKIDENGLLKLQYAGTGFMLIKVEILKKMYHKVKEYIYCSATGINENEDGEEYYRAFFDFEYNLDSRLISEDYFFCKLWRTKFGGDVFLDTNLNLAHEGNKVYIPDITVKNFLKQLEGRNTREII